MDILTALSDVERVARLRVATKISLQAACTPHIIFNDFSPATFSAKSGGS
jgi:hypothetical protein